MTPYYADDWLTVYHGDCKAVMAGMEPESVHCVVTSPPYWGLRDYGTATWIGGDEACDHTSMRRPGPDDKSFTNGGTSRDKPTNLCRLCGATRQDSQLGLEPTPEEYVANMVAVFREVRRVLRADGTVWLNLGDSYASQPAGNLTPSYGPQFVGRDMTGVGQSGRMDKIAASGLKPKDLVGIPWRVAFALQVDGWYLRSDIIWSKPNPMPESVTDRPTKSHEYLFLLSKSPRYYFDAEAVRTLAQSGPSDLRKMAESRDRIGGLVKEQTDPLLRASALTNIGRKRSVGGRPLERERGVGGRDDGFTRMPGGEAEWAEHGRAGRNIRSVWTIATAPYPGAHFATFPPKLVEPCIKAGSPSGGLVLDPFAGSGTTGMVAQSLSRRAVLIDLSLDYLGQLMDRNRDIPLGLESA